MRNILLLLLMGATCHAQVNHHAYDEKAPELALKEALQVPGGVVPMLAGLRGKVVVLEFWSTWCEPCVEQIPHLNQVAEEVRGEPVVFLSVSDEDTAVVQAFLKTKR